MIVEPFSGRGQLIERLAWQVGSLKAALTILQQRGHLDGQGHLTPEGQRRNQMTAEERARDRAGGAPGSYNPRTNRITSVRPLSSLAKIKSL